MIAIPPALARSVFEDAPDAMIIIDAFGTIWFANRQLCQLFGYSHEEIVGESIERLVPERFRARHVGHRGDFGSNVRVRPMGAGLDLNGRRRDATEFPLEVSLSPIEDVGRTLVAAAIRDVTGRKRAEAELVAARDAIEALLDIGKLESGAIHPKPTDFALAALFEELHAEFTNIAAGKGLQIEIEPCDARVHGDPKLVHKILRNLLSNAIHYTREGRVRVQCLREAARVRIEVLDTGVGISPDQVPYIFEEFHPVDVPAAGAQDGYGLGLNIVRRLANLLKLELHVRSEVGRGSAFSIVLPRAATV